MNTLDTQVLALMDDILTNGVKKHDRTGTGTLSVFGRHIRHNMQEGFSLLTTKRIYTKGVRAELIWFLNGETNNWYLVKDKTNIWVGDNYKAFRKRIKGHLANNRFINQLVGNGILIPCVPSEEDYLHGTVSLRIADKEEFTQLLFNSEQPNNPYSTRPNFAEMYGNLGPIYGAQWRNWRGIDQIDNLVHMLKNDPDSRRLIVSAWNVDELDNMVLHPCHYGFQCWTRELSIQEREALAVKCYGDKGLLVFEDESDIARNHSIYDTWEIPRRAISLSWDQRSVDTFLGLPFNIASYGMILLLLAKECNMMPEWLEGNLKDTHLYLNHIEQAKLQLTRQPLALPTLDIVNYASKGPVGVLKGLTHDNFLLSNYNPYPAIEAPLSN